MWIKQLSIISLSLALTGCCVAGVETYYTCELSLPAPFALGTQRYELFKGLNGKLAKDERSPQELAQELARELCYTHLGPLRPLSALGGQEPAAARAHAVKQEALMLAWTLSFERCQAQVKALPHTCKAHKTINPTKNLDFNPVLH